MILGNNPAESHANWCDYKIRQGWVFGPVKDFSAKTHPDLVSYDSLPAEQKDKDRLFHAIVKVLR